MAGLAAVALTVISPAASFAADEAPLPGSVGSVIDGTRSTLSDATSRLGGDVAKQRSLAVPGPSSDDDSAGHETADPTGPDHGSAAILHAGVADQDLATVGDNDASVGNDDSTKADSTLLAIGGQEILGTHADSEGTEESHFGDPLAPLCEGSEGQVCLRVLYADAWATDDGSTSYSRSGSGVADVCLGGDDPDPAADCSGPVSTGVATSEGEAERDQQSGRTTASSASDVADVCVEEDPETGGCAVGVGALHSEGQSDSGGSNASAERDSYLLALDLGGEEQGRIGDPEALALPPGCPDGASALCLFLNQGETYVGDGTAGHAQEALHLSVLPGNLDLLAELSRSESLVHNDGGEPAVRGEESSKGPGFSGGPGRPGAAVAPAAALLPNTGGVWSGLLALALFGIGAGSLLTAWSRRRVGTLA